MLPVRVCWVRERVLFKLLDFFRGKMLVSTGLRGRILFVNHDKLRETRASKQEEGVVVAVFIINNHDLLMLISFRLIECRQHQRSRTRNFV